MEKKTIFKVNNWAKLKSIIGPSWGSKKKAQLGPVIDFENLRALFFYFKNCAETPIFIGFFYITCFFLNKLGPIIDFENPQTWPNYWLKIRTFRFFFVLMFGAKCTVSGDDLRLKSEIRLRSQNCTQQFFEGLIARPPTLNHCKWCPQACRDWSGKWFKSCNVLHDRENYSQILVFHIP